jgi:hypothetical protein
MRLGAVIGGYGFGVMFFVAWCLLALGPEGPRPGWGEVPYLILGFFCNLFPGTRVVGLILAVLLTGVPFAILAWLVVWACSKINVRRFDIRYLDITGGDDHPCRNGTEPKKGSNSDRPPSDTGASPG